MFRILLEEEGPFRTHPSEEEEASQEVLEVGVEAGAFQGHLVKEAVEAASCLPDLAGVEAAEVPSCLAKEGEEGF